MGHRIDRTREEEHKGGKKKEKEKGKRKGKR